MLINEHRVGDREKDTRRLRDRDKEFLDECRAIANFLRHTGNAALLSVEERERQMGRQDERERRRQGEREEGRVGVRIIQK